MYYMKRAENKALEKPGTKVKKIISAKISRPEKTTASVKKTIAIVEKKVKKSSPATAVKISVPAPPAKKAVAAKSVKQAKPVVLKNKPVAAAEKKGGKTNTKSPAKVSTPAPKAKKSASVEVNRPEKAPVLKKKTLPADEKVAKKLKPAVSAPKVKKTAKVSAAAKPQKEKIVRPVAVPKAKPATEKPLPATTDKKVRNVRKTTEIVVPAINRKTAKKAKPAAKKVEIIIPPVKAKVKKQAEVALKKTAQKPLKKIAKKVEIVIPPVTVKPVRKKIKPIGSAVVRGKSGRYDFEVFPLDADLKDGSAIYVISKRITDKRGRGHHKFVCIGQTESLLGEIKKHKKDKCIKQHKANVICLLREESETNRLKIETDLREAHSIACNQK